MAQYFEQPVPVPDNNSNPATPTAEQDPAERPLELDPSRDPDVHPDPLTDTNARIPRIPLNGAVEGVPESYPANPTADAPLPSEASPVSSPEHPEKPNRKRNRIIGGVVAGTVIIAGAVVGVIKANDGDHDAAPTAQDPVATATGNPGNATTTPSLNASESASVPEPSQGSEASQAPGVIMPDTVKSYVTVPGNISPGTSPYPGEPAIEIRWANQEQPMDSLPDYDNNPGGPNEMANGVLSLLAGAISFKPDTPNWDKVVNALTPEGVAGQSLRDDIRKWNQEFQDEQGTPYTDRAMFFDSRDDPVNFTVSTDEVGDQVYTLSSGKLYERRLRNDAKPDPQAAQIENFAASDAYSPNDARVFPEFSFITYRMPDGSTRILSIQFPESVFQGQ